MKSKFIECVRSSEYWNLTIGDIYTLNLDGDESELFIKDDMGTKLHLEYLPESSMLSLIADHDCIFTHID
ncbi:hypothetical protein [Escherichia phage TR2]|nr:hypothetical protein [Escherichia phage TR2]WDS61397.1 hypothetical protein CY1_00064 [Escherichia phage CY1_Cui-2023]